MPVTVKLRYLRIAPRKVRLVADLIRGKSVKSAQTILQFTTKRAALVLLKLLKSGMAAARHDFKQEPDNLYIAKITVDEGPKLKRWRPRARGRAFPIQKKTSHITFVLEGIAREAKKTVAAKKVEPVPAVQEEKRERAAVKKQAAKPRPELTRRAKEERGQKLAAGLRRVFRRKAF